MQSLVRHIGWTFVFLSCSAWAQTNELNLKVDQLLNELRVAVPGADRTNEYKKFLGDVAELSRRFPSWSKGASPVKGAIVDLALEVEKPEVECRIQELQDWYGGFVYELPDQLFRAYTSGGIALTKKLGKEISHNELRKILREGSASEKAKAKPHTPPVVDLRAEHLKPEYLSAWAFWLLAPPSKARELMSGRINIALQRIGVDKVLPLLVGGLKIESSRTQPEHLKRGKMVAMINLICGSPSVDALNALLEINRHVIEKGLNGDDYFNSITRHIVRRLASRRPYADQLIDPKMKETIARQGYNEKPEQIPLIDELWKQYRPLVAARLQSRTVDTPQEDIELLEAAQEIMPKAVR